MFDSKNKTLHRLMKRGGELYLEERYAARELSSGYGFKSGQISALAMAFAEEIEELEYRLGKREG